MKVLGLTNAASFSLSSIDSLLLLYFTLVKSRFDHASVTGNILTCTDASQLGLIQRKFLALCLGRFFP
jgi:hypothetical protein